MDDYALILLLGRRPLKTLSLIFFFNSFNVKEKTSQDKQMVFLQIKVDGTSKLIMRYKVENYNKKNRIDLGILFSFIH